MSRAQRQTPFLRRVQLVSLAFRWFVAAGAFGFGFFGTVPAGVESGPFSRPPTCSFAGADTAHGARGAEKTKPKGPLGNEARRLLCAWAHNHFSRRLFEARCVLVHHVTVPGAILVVARSGQSPFWRTPSRASRRTRPGPRWHRPDTGASEIDFLLGDSFTGPSPKDSRKSYDISTAEWSRSATRIRIQMPS